MAKKSITWKEGMKAKWIGRGQQERSGIIKLIDTKNICAVMIVDPIEVAVTPDQLTPIDKQKSK